jgi:hypothetical protein
MLSNKEIRRIFQLYAELLRVHEMEEKLAATLSSEAYQLAKKRLEVSLFY